MILPQCRCRLLWALLTGGVLLGAGCRNADSDWRKTVAANTAQAYQEFARRYPAEKRIRRVVGTFTGHSIMVGEDGRLLTGLFGGEPPGFELRAASHPDFVYKMSVADATAAGLLPEGRLELAALYTYTGGELIVVAKPRSGGEAHILVCCRFDRRTVVPDDGKVLASRARALQVALAPDVPAARGR